MNLILNSIIYPESAINNAIRAYSKLAQIRYTKKTPHYSISFRRCKPGFAKIIRDEFANYVLGLARKCI